MEQLRTTVLSACFLSTAVGICSLVRPGGRLTGQIRFLFALLFVVSLVSPLAGLDLTQVPAEYTAAIQAQDRAGELGAAADAALVRTASEQAAQAVAALLGEAGITCAQAEAGIHIDEDGCISLTEVRVSCSDCALAGRILRETLGEGVELDVTQLMEPDVPET